MKQNKMIAGIVITLLLVFVFWYGGDAPGLRGWPVPHKGSVSTTQPNLPMLTPPPTDTPEPTATPAPTEPVNPEETDQVKPETLENEDAGKDYYEVNGMIVNEVTGKDNYFTDPVPEGKPLPVEPQDVLISTEESTCFLSVRCDTILNNISWLDPQKIELVPNDGVIFSEKEVTFYEGESVFHVLLREMKRNKIHMEFENTPIYNSAYIEGIANLYEFDCGELSGWMYRVNGWFPNYGCSRYQLKPGDRIEWVYTCDLGRDVGGYHSVGNGREYE